MLQSILEFPRYLKKKKKKKKKVKNVNFVAAVFTLSQCETF
jgi:hypothetical protein